MTPWREGANIVWPTGIPTGAGDEAAHGADTGGESEGDEEEISNIAGTTKMETGDIDAAFAEADVIVERSFETPMVHQSSIETQGWVAQPNPLERRHDHVGQHAVALRRAL